MITIFLFLLFLMVWQGVLQSSTMWWWWWFSRSVVSDACDPMDCSLPASSVHGILQARILEWIAISFSRGSSQPGNQTHISYASCIGKQVFYHQYHLGSPPHTPQGGQKENGSLSGPSHIALVKELCSTLSAFFLKTSRTLTLSFIFKVSFWLTSLCIIGSSFIHLIRTDSNVFFLM